MSSEWHLNHLEGMSLGKERPGEGLRGWRVLYTGTRTCVQTPRPLVKLDVAANVPLPLQGHSIPWCSSFLYSSLPCFQDNSGLTLIPFRSPWASKDSQKPCLRLSAPLKMAYSKHLALLLHTPPETPQSASNSHSFVYVCVCVSHVHTSMCVCTCMLSVFLNQSPHYFLIQALSPVLELTDS